MCFWLIRAMKVIKKQNGKLSNIHSWRQQSKVVFNQMDDSICWFSWFLQWKGLNYQHLLIKESIILICEGVPKNDTERCLTLFCKGKNKIHIANYGWNINISEDLIKNHWSLINDAKFIDTELYMIRDRR